MEAVFMPSISLSVAFWVLAFLASLWVCCLFLVSNTIEIPKKINFKILEILFTNGKKNFQYQFLFNFIGAILGWSALWYLVTNGFKLDAEHLILVGFAFSGIFGYLPQIASIMSPLKP